MSDGINIILTIIGVHTVYLITFVGAAIISPILWMTLPSMCFISLILGDTIMTPAAKKIGSSYLMLPYHLWWGYIYLVAWILSRFYHELYPSQLFQEFREWKMILMVWLSIPFIVLVAVFSPLV